MGAVGGPWDFNRRNVEFEFFDEKELLLEFVVVVDEFFAEGFALFELILVDEDVLLQKVNFLLQQNLFLLGFMRLRLQLINPRMQE